MKTIAGSTLCAVVCLSVSAVAQTPVGALAIDERQGDQYGWAVDYETAGAASQWALSECGSGCSVVLTFERCAAYAADQDANSTAVGWSESYGSADSARQAALTECRSRGGSGCVVRVWGCNSHVLEQGLGLDRAARRQVQEDLQAAGFDPGGADGIFGPRTRAAIRSWQRARGARGTGYLDGTSVASLRPSVAGQPTFRDRRSPTPPPLTPRPPASAVVSRAEVEAVFWESIANSTNPAEFEAYLAQFPTGVFRGLAEARLAARSAPATAPSAPAAADRPAAGPGSPTSDSRVSGADGASLDGATGVDVPRRAGNVFRDCPECPEMVVLPGGRMAMGRYEVTVAEYRAFSSATQPRPPSMSCSSSESWRDPGFPQTDRHPITCVNWHDAEAYVQWLSRLTRSTYRLPTEAEWERAAADSQPGCDEVGKRTPPRGTCPVGSSGANAVGLSDMVGNLWEWTSSCWEGEGDCIVRVIRGGAWVMAFPTRDLHPGVRDDASTGNLGYVIGFRVLKTLD